MFFETVKSEGLAHLSYVLGDAGEAVVIDPRRDCDVYLDIAEREGVRITHIFETHRNEDYVIGSCALAARTGATIHHGQALDFEYGQPARDGEELEIGSLRLRVLETPGHTPESISIALSDLEFSEKPVGVFTGDCLFIGDVGRTDLNPEGQERKGAGDLYDSVFHKLLPLGEGVNVFPAHGSGSVCGSGMADREFSTLGFERRNNPALQVGSRDEFIENKLSETHYRPPYFDKMEEYNLVGPPDLPELPRPEPLGVAEFAKRMQQGMLVVDVRQTEAWLGVAIPGSLSIPVDMLPSFAGWFVDHEQDVGLVAADQADLRAALRHLVRLGYDRVPYQLSGGITAWETSGSAYHTTRAVHVKEVAEWLDDDGYTLLDVRKIEEVEEGAIPESTHVYLGELPRRIEQVPRQHHVTAFCGSGQRATIAASLLRQRGYEHVDVCMGSFTAWQARDLEVED